MCVVDIALRKVVGKPPSLQELFTYIKVLYIQACWIPLKGVGIKYPHIHLSTIYVISNEAFTSKTITDVPASHKRVFQLMDRS